MQVNRNRRTPDRGRKHWLYTSLCNYLRIEIEEPPIGDENKCVRHKTETQKNRNRRTPDRGRKLLFKSFSLYLKRIIEIEEPPIGDENTISFPVIGSPFTIEIEEPPIGDENILTANSLLENWFIEIEEPPIGDENCCLIFILI